MTWVTRCSVTAAIDRARPRESPEFGTLTKRKVGPVIAYFLGQGWNLGPALESAAQDKKLRNMPLALERGVEIEGHCPSP